jgi:cobalt/nickel transport system permease protein
MHIPDGYISPLTYGIGYIVSLPLWAVAFKKLKKDLNEETLPLIATLSALSFVIMMFNIPIPGGTSGHALGVAIISILFSPWIGFLSLSLVLFIQAILFGDGGITSFAINALSMGFLGAFSAKIAYDRFKSYKYAPFIAGWVSAVASSILVAFVLGIQPLIALQDGKPLYFPFGLDVTFPALVGSHILFFGVVEGIFTQLAYKFLVKLEPNLIKEYAK